MLVSKRLDGLHRMMQNATMRGWENVSPLSRRMVALGIISEMQVVIDLLDALNEKLDQEISIEDADIDFDQWADRRAQSVLFNSNYYIEGEEDDVTINRMTALFPSGNSTTFHEETKDTLKTGMGHLGKDAALNHSDIAVTLRRGYESIAILLSKIKQKMTDASGSHYENFCDEFLISDLDLVFQEVEREYTSWKDEHEWESLQALEDKRTQEILCVLKTGVFSHSTLPTNREIRECPIEIFEDALERNMTIPEDIDIECARLNRFVLMNGGIMQIDYAKLGKYLYRHYKELTYEEEMALKSFTVALDLIQRDMAVLDPNLKVYLPDYEDNMMQALLDNAINIINTCKPYLNDKLSQDFLESYINDLFFGELRQEMHKKIGSKAVYTHICKMLGMLRISMKVFKAGTSSEDLAKLVSTLTQKPSKESMKRKIDEGAADKNSAIRKWTDNYIREHCYSKVRDYS